MPSPGTPRRRRASSGSSTPLRSSPRRPPTTPQSRRPVTPHHGPLENVPSPGNGLGGRSLSPVSGGDHINATSPAPSTRGLAMSDLDLSSPLNYGTPSSQSSATTPRSGVRGTPIRPRSDIRSDRRIRQVQLGRADLSDIMEDLQIPSSDPMESEAETQLVIWGTDVVVNVCKNKFKKFVLRFINPDVEEDERNQCTIAQEPLYLQRLEEINTLEEPFFNLNCLHIQQFDAELYRQLVCYPQEVIPTFDMAINEMFFERYPDAQLLHQIQVRPFNAEKTVNMRSLNPEDIDQLITICGMVIRLSNIIPEMREAFFCCNVCGHSVTVEIDRGRIAEPTLCVNCNTSYSYALIHNRSQFSDKQGIKLQESPEDMPPGQTPHTIMLHAHNDLVDAVQPGDRITVTGIYRAVPIRPNPRQRNIKAVYKTHIDVVHFRKIDTKRLREDTDQNDINLPPERIEMIKSLSQRKDIYECLARALAPSIYENEDIKKGIILLLFGGTKKDFTNASRGKFRSEINMLLCGDPGTSKSQLLQYVHSIVPRGQYTSGKGSSAVGLTAYVSKDPETKQHVLQSGALALSDNGVCCIDEFDKMNDSSRSILHEVMEQQTLSIAKAGIICQLNARTSILAAANPCESQWNKNKTIIENIQLPPTLLSRFDLIFLILDPQDEKFDRRLARHLVSIYHQTQEETNEEYLSHDVLKDYVAYAKAKIHPQLNSEAGDCLIQAYLDMRKIGNGRGQVSAYPRQLESLIRLSEAHAKVRLSNVVEVVDVEEAIRIHREALKQSATDPSSGKIDVSIITTGLSSAGRSRRAEISKALKDLIVEKGKVTALSFKKTLAELRDRMDITITRDMFEDALQDLQQMDFLSLSSKNHIRINHS